MSLSDTLFETERQIHAAQALEADPPLSVIALLNEARANLIAARLQLDWPASDPREWLNCNPYYRAALLGDPSPSDAYMDGDDSLHEEWVQMIRQSKSSLLANGRLMPRPAFPLNKDVKND